MSELDKTTISARLPTRLVKLVDELSENRTEFLTEAVIRRVHDEEIVREEIKRQKQERDQLINQKQRIEREIESQRDDIRELENLLTEIRSLNKVEDKIPDSEIHQVRKIVRKNKYDNDPRSLSPEAVIQHNADNLSDRYDVEKEKVVEFLRIRASA